MRVLVTGGGGFIGKAVMTVLAQRNIDATTFDYPRDVTDSISVWSAVREADAVIHLAGVLGTAELFGSAHRAVDVNVKGTLNVLQSCATHQAGYVGITMPEVWDNVYQATKKCSRVLASAWNRHEGVPVSHVRAFNAFGEGQKVNGVQKIVPTFAHRAWRNEPIPIWGDGNQTVDLVYVGDLAKMLVDALDYGHDETFDAGTGVAMTVAEVAQLTLERTGSRAGIAFHPMRSGEHEVKIVASGDGWETLGWHPEFLQADFDRSVDWYRADRP